MGLDVDVTALRQIHSYAYTMTVINRVSLRKTPKKETWLEAIPICRCCDVAYENRTEWAGKKTRMQVDV